MLPAALLGRHLLGFRIRCSLLIRHKCQTKKARDMSQKPWLVVHVTHRAEDRVSGALAYKGYEVFVPKTIHHHAKAKCILRCVPVFPGYVFCRGITPSPGLVVTTPGVLQILGCGGRPSTLDDSEISTIRQMTMSGYPYGPYPYLQSGARVRIVNGPLKGTNGVVVKMSNKERVVISLHFLMRSVFVDVPSEDVVPASDEGVNHDIGEDVIRYRYISVATSRTRLNEVSANTFELL
jgi:transcription antitermination factor NusG